MHIVQIDEHYQDAASERMSPLHDQDTEPNCLELTLQSTTGQSMASRQSLNKYSCFFCANELVSSGCSRQYGIRPSIKRSDNYLLPVPYFSMKMPQFWCTSSAVHFVVPLPNWCNSVMSCDVRRFSQESAYELTDRRKHGTNSITSTTETGGGYVKHGCPGETASYLMKCLMWKWKHKMCLGPPKWHAHDW